MANNTTNSSEIVTFSVKTPREKGLPLIAMASSWVALAIVSATLNVLVCLAVYKNKKLRTITNCFVVSLSFADLLVAIVFVPVYIIDHYLKTIISGYLIAFMLLASIFNLAAVTYERYVALTRPFGYRMIMSQGKVTFVMSVAWVSPIILALLPLAWNTNVNSVYHQVYKIILTVVFILIPCIAMTWVYSRLLCVVRSYVHRNRKRASVGNRTGNRAGKEEKAARVFALVFAMFLLCWGPIIYINICEVLDAHHLINIELIYVSFYTLLVNSIVDPVIYAFFKRDFIIARRQATASWWCTSTSSSSDCSDQQDTSRENVLQRLTSIRQSGRSRSKSVPC